MFCRDLTCSGKQNRRPLEPVAPLIKANHLWSGSRKQQPNSRHRQASPRWCRPGYWAGLHQPDLAGSAGRTDGSGWAADQHLHQPAADGGRRPVPPRGGPERPGAAGRPAGPERHAGVRSGPQRQRQRGQPEPHGPDRRRPLQQNQVRSNGTEQ